MQEVYLVMVHEFLDDCPWPKIIFDTEEKADEYIKHKYDTDMDDVWVDEYEVH